MNSNDTDPRPVDERGGQRVNPWPAVVVMLGLVVLGLVVMTGGKANAGGTLYMPNQSSQPAWTQPYGGCKEAMTAPQSIGADECRSHRWIVRSRVVINPRGYVVATMLEPCPREDSGQCYWEAGRVGNQRGHSFVNLGSTDQPRLIYVKGFRR